MALEVNTVVMYFIFFIFSYLFGFLYIRGGIISLKSGVNSITGGEANVTQSKASIFYGGSLGIGGSSWMAYLICAEIFNNFIDAALASYLSFVAPALVISATAFYFYRYWKNYIPDRPSEDMPERDSDKAEELYDRGWKLVQQRRYSEAIECYDKAIQITPNSARAWYYKGWAFLKHGKYLDAIPCYDKAIRINPNFAKVWFDKGRVLEKLSKWWEAQECFNKARELVILQEQREWDNFRKEMKEPK